MRSAPSSCSVQAHGVCVRQRKSPSPKKKCDGLQFQMQHWEEECAAFSLAIREEEQHIKKGRSALCSLELMTGMRLDAFTLILRGCGRLCQPWITPSILEGALGELADEAASRYLVEHFPGRYIFKSQYDRSGSRPP